MACIFLQFIFISPTSAERIKIKFYRSILKTSVISPHKRL